MYFNLKKFYFKSKNFSWIYQLRLNLKKSKRFYEIFGFESELKIFQMKIKLFKDNNFE